MRKLKITFILPYAGLAGGIRVVAYYARGLSQRGHDVAVISVPEKPMSFKEKIRSFKRYKRWPSKRQKRSHFDDIEVARKVLEEYRPITNDDVPDADIVIATWWETAIWVNSFKASKGRKVYFMQDYGAPGQELEKIIPTWFFPFHKITIAQWLVDLIREKTGDVSVDLVPNAVDHNLFSAGPRGKQKFPTAGFVYRSTYSKGADIVLGAFEKILQKHNEFRLVAFGPELAPEFHSAQFTYHRAPQEKDLPTLYSSCDMWIFPSKLEGFGLPIMEAMACRTPVIATPSGAAPELLHNGGGVLLSGFTETEMVQAMEKISAMTDSAWEAMSQKAYESVASYTWDNATDLFENALLNLSKIKTI